MNNFIYISIGSNIDPETNIPKSLVMLKEYLYISNISPVFITPPIGGKEKQPDFYNCVVETEPRHLLTPLELKFNILRNIETQLKRIRSEDKYIPRTIDLDILLFNDIVQNDENITIPDPDIFSRNFLFAGLLYLNPELVIYPEKHPLISKVDEYNIETLKINCQFTQKLWKDFLNEH